MPDRPLTPPLVSRAAPHWHDAVGLTILSLIINLIGISTRSLVFDEATSVSYATSSLREFVRILAGGDPNMGLYYVLLRAWIGVAGDSELAVRLPSAIFAALAAGTLYVLGVRLVGRSVGIVSAMLLSSNGLVVMFAHTARSYALVVFLAVVSTYLFVEELDRPSRRRRIAYAIVSALAIYAHYLAALIMLVHLVTLLVLERRNALTRERANTVIGFFLLLVPAIVPVLLRRGRRNNEWISPLTPADLWLVPVDLAGGSGALLLVMIAGGAYALFSARQGQERRALGLVTTWLVLPILVLLGWSFVQPMFISTYLLFCVPALALFAASATRNWRPLFVAVCVAPFLWFSFQQTASLNSPAAAENWRDASRHILANARAGDAIAFFPGGSRKPFEYYERQLGITPQVRPVRPPKSDSARVWVLVRDSDLRIRPAGHAMTLSSITDRYHLAEQRHFRRLTVELYVP